MVIDQARKAHWHRVVAAQPVVRADGKNLAAGFANNIWLHAPGEAHMTDARSGSVPKPARSRWTSFVGSFAKGRTVRGLEEEGNPKHRARVEHNKHTLLVHISDEDGRGWTTLAIDRATREWSITQRSSQLQASEAAYGLLYVDGDKTP